MPNMHVITPYSTVIFSRHFRNSPREICNICEVVQEFSDPYMKCVFEKCEEYFYFSSYTLDNFKTLLILLELKYEISMHLPHIHKYLHFLGVYNQHSLNISS